MRSWKACTLEFLCETSAELVINGMGEMGPRENCTRAEAAALVTAGIRCTPDGHTEPLTSRAPPLRGEQNHSERAASMHTDGTNLAPDVELDGPENNDMWDSEDEAPAVADTEPELEEPDVTVSTWPADASTPALSKWMAIKLKKWKRVSA